MSGTVLLTGATSFTGCHIAAALKGAGFRVVATLTRGRGEYTDALTLRRMELATPDAWVEHAPFGSPKMLETIATEKPVAFINHGADIRGYRRPDFDYLKSVASSLSGAESVMKALAAAGTRRFVHTGSIFEPDEGATDPLEMTPAVSIYGTSKSMVWQALRYFAESAQLGVSKVIIPDPVGPWENTDRLIPYFVSQWKEGKEPVVKTPHLVRDRVPAAWLARVYAEECARGAESGLVIRRPGAYAMENEAFLNLFLKRVGKKNVWKFRVEPTPVNEPLERVNREACLELGNAQAEEAFWSAWTAALGI